ncbi:serine/threonine-protein kinase [Sorangium sp. So ce1024]|uniref:serine/threonine-protein kinase n=1 Tax=Sorangium sp. So ce1024 TaxID=3133327 RepID=UPI003F0BBE2F
MARRTSDSSGFSGVAGDALEGTPYRALRALGRGGMGEVVEAEHRALRKRVVVKLVRRAFARDPRFADRLRVEAQALAAVSSPHVVEVLDLGRTPAGRPYFVMERLEGTTLADELARRGALPVDEAIDVVRQVLAGLSAAHRVGLVHRDVKLDNVFLCAPGSAPGGGRVVKLLDFGVAKVLDGGVAAGAPGAPVPLALDGPAYPTEAGLLVGTPRTASPEQARCQPVDARADVYAVGLLMYTLVVGHGPFAHLDDALEVLRAHVLEAPAPPSLCAAQRIPPALDRAVLKALAKRPEERFQSAEAFAEELGRIAAGLSKAEPEGGACGVGVAGAVGASAPGAGAVGAGAAGASAAGAGRGASSAAAARAPMGAVAGPGEEEAAWNPGIGAWSEAMPAGAGAAGARACVAPPDAGEAEAPVDARLFAGLTAASTVVFSLIAALLLRSLGVW